MATLAFGAICIWVCQKLSAISSKPRILIAVIVCAFLCLLAEVQHFSYGAMGILLIVGLYICCGAKHYQAIVVIMWSVFLYGGIVA
ncbi:MAG: hypothetical protein LBS24_07895, partial [Clostridiales Family XIII bacterium]|nr:hypothetical protein [Clostridiales Family XIII bacterium]